MKLYNKTRCPNALVESILLRAGKACGKVRTTGVIVIVTRATTGRVRGLAHEASGVYEFALRRFKQRHKAKITRGRCINTDGGYFSISLPLLSPNARTHWVTDALHRAEQFFCVAVHEWGHIRDYQAGGSWKLPWAVTRQGHRRENHDDRPEERRANRYAREAESRIKSGTVQSPDDAILDLALWLEESGV